MSAVSIRPAPGEAGAAGGTPAGGDRAVRSEARAPKPQWGPVVILSPVRYLASGDVERAGQPSARILRLATAVAGTWSVALPLWRIYGMVDESLRPQGDVRYAALGLVPLVPLQLWLTISLTRSRRRRAESWVLLALLGIDFGLAPVVGGGWVGMLYVPSALALVVLPIPWSGAVFLGLVAVQPLLTQALGLLNYGSYFVVGTLAFGVPLALGVVAIRTARELESVRGELADEAVEKERKRLDAELRHTLEDRLATIAQLADRAAQLAMAEREQAASGMRTAVEGARETLSEARRLATSLRNRSFRDELETTVTLLAAAGITAHLAFPTDFRSEDLDARLRGELRRAVAELLATDGTREATISLASGDARVAITMHAMPGRSPTPAPFR